ncbi:MAG: DNA mismatch repair protein MutS [Kiritimatiellaeota bacterium]|nr:DNA mismatch repair protein MutS [Kiritimatiellota bacterium]
MKSNSILFKNADEAVELPEREVSDLFHDLNLDQVLHELCSGKHDYNFASYFRMPLNDAKSIKFRQDVMRDFEKKDVAKTLNDFSAKLAESERYMSLSRESRFKECEDGWFLDATLSYKTAVTSLQERLSKHDLNSEGLLAWRECLSEYVASGKFNKMAEQAEIVKKRLSAIGYTIRIKENTCTIRKRAGETDLETEIDRTFRKFQENSAKDYLSDVKFKSLGMNSVRGRVIECVAKLYSREFEALREFRGEFANFIDGRVKEFDRESQFLLAYLDYTAPLKKRGLPFSYPEISDSKSDIRLEGMFDLALAHQLLSRDEPMVLNELRLEPGERILVVSGPNQGGKTTFARAFGQTHYLAKLGFPVPSRRTTLFLCDRVLTHFEREEQIANLRGKLQDDLVRIHDLLKRTTSDSIVILNEIFNSTTLKDGVFLGWKILDEISGKDALCLFVTFLEELSRPMRDGGALKGKIVSLVSVAHPENPAERTYKIVRKPADGRAYAKVMAEKHRLTHAGIKERIRQ